MTLRTITFDDSTHKICPIEATDEMVEAAWDSNAADYIGEHKRIHYVALAYEVMIAAAPEYFDESTYQDTKKDE